MQITQFVRLAAWLCVLAMSGCSLESSKKEAAGAGSEAQVAKAVETWRRTPGEASALALARAYFPEYASEEAAAQATPSQDEELALRVTLPGTAGGAMALEARGYRFSVRQQGLVRKHALAERPGAAFYGAARFWAPVGHKQVDEAGRWVTHRIEEYVVKEAGQGEHRERYEVDIPEGISVVRDAGEWLEFQDSRGTTVLRLHAPVARGAEGQSRQGQVRLHGAVRVESPTDPLPRYALAGSKLTVDMAVDLEGLRGPVVVDPGWSSGATMGSARRSHTATLLLTGQVLAAGGGTATTELYDPATKSWAAMGRMAVSRSNHTATLLPSGRVLVAGGDSVGTTAELYDPATDGWTQVDAMATARSSHTATLLPSGKVLVVGGLVSTNTSTANVELYDPVTAKWSEASPLITPRHFHTATLLPGGKVLVVGGLRNTTDLNSSELYDPETGRWSAAASMAYARYQHTTTLLPSGKVLVAGIPGYYTYTQTELYDPETGSWSTTGSLKYQRYLHTATLLPSGKVLLTGGYNNSYGYLQVAELYDPQTGSWSTTDDLPTARYQHTATLLPSGKVLVAGGSNGSSLSVSTLYDPPPGGWRPAGSMVTARSGYTLTLLLSGHALAAGGRTASGTTSTCEVYDSRLGAWTATSSLSSPREAHTATLLPTGRVLVTGGSNSGTSLAGAELYEPAAGTWSQTAPMARARSGHAAVMLSSGLVLVMGGTGPTGSLAEAELYDPVTGTWRSTGSMNSARYHHTATLLPSGKVLVTGGYDASGPIASAELYDPATGTWSSTMPLATARAAHRATLLNSGRVLVVGGFQRSSTLSSAELYDPQTQLWSQLVPMAHPRALHTATLLPSGRVLVTGGTNGSGDYYASAELYDPELAQWLTLDSMSMTRASHAVLLLPSGRALMAGGTNVEPLGSAQLFDDTGASDAWRPIVNHPTVLRAGATALLVGAGLRGVSQASGGSTQDSPSNIPMASLWSTEGMPLAPMPGRSLTADSVTVEVPSVAPGHYLLFLNVNGVSGGRLVRVSADNRAPVALATSRTTSRRRPVPVVLQATDVDGDALTYTVVTQPLRGTLSGSGASLVYTPNEGFTGSDSFTFKANDGALDSNVAAVSLWVTNSAPVAQPTSVAVPKNQVGAVTLIARDTEGDSLTYTVVTPPTRGTLSGTAPGLLYTPPAGYTGSDSFTFRVSDGLASSLTATVSISVVNTAPLAQALSVQTAVNTPAAVTLWGTDADGDALTYAVVSQPARGTLSGTPPALLYTPEPGYTGTDSFTYRASDGTASSAVATVSLQVDALSINLAPPVPVVPASPGVPAPSGGLVLNWQPSVDEDGDAVLYRLELSRDGAVVGMYSSSEPKILLPAGKLTPGTYQWRVEAVDAKGQSSGFSTPQTLVVDDTGHVSAVPPPAATGCSSSGPGSGPGVLLLGLLALAGLTVRSHPRGPGGRAHGSQG
jgi:large repetitive protein